MLKLPMNIVSKIPFKCCITWDHIYIMCKLTFLPPLSGKSGQCKHGPFDGGQSEARSWAWQEDPARGPPTLVFHQVQ